MPAKSLRNRVIGTALLAAACCTSCAENPTATDPFAWCEHQGTTEAKIGGQFTPLLAEAMVAQGLVSADAPAQVQEANAWRCMDGSVWVCPLGANLPCAEKADLSREPTPAMSAWCNDSPGAAIPAYVTGRATVYNWTCDGTNPVIEKQLGTADKAGYLAEFWYRLNRPQG